MKYNNDYFSRTRNKLKKYRNKSKVYTGKLVSKVDTSSVIIEDIKDYKTNEPLTDHARVSFQDSIARNVIWKSLISMEDIVKINKKQIEPVDIVFRTWVNVYDGGRNGFKYFLPMSECFDTVDTCEKCEDVTSCNNLNEITIQIGYYYYTLYIDEEHSIFVKQNRDIHSYGYGLVFNRIVVYNIHNGETTELWKHNI